MLSAINLRYAELLQTHAQASKRMSPIDKFALERRLFTMAKREFLPYGKEFFQEVSQQKEFEVFLEPMRMRSKRY
jgi:hypothetical protein